MVSRLLLALLPLLLLCSSALGSEQVFLFDQQSAQATVLDGETLAMLAQPEVGSGATDVFRFEHRGEARYYVVTSGGVAILGADYQSLGAIGLPVASGRTLAASAPTQGKLLVVRGAHLYLIDTQVDAIDTVMTLDFEPAGLAVRPSESRVLVLGVDRRSLWEFDLASWTLHGPTSSLPARADALAVSSGGGRVAASSGRGLFELASSDVGGKAGVFPLAESSGELLAVDDAGSAVIGLDGELHGLLGGEPEAIVLRDPGSGQALGNEVLAVGLANGRAVVLTNDSRLLRLGIGEAEQVFLSGDAVGLSVVGDPVEQGGVLTKGSGDPTVAAGGGFEVRVLGPSGGVFMNAVADPDIVTCDTEDVVFDGDTTLQCVAANVAQTTSTTLTVTALGLGQVTFQVTVFVAAQDGLTAISPTNLSAGPGDSVVFEVLLTDGQPVVGADLGVSDDSGLLDCPAATIETDAAGRASITCEVDEDFEAQTVVSLTISDGSDDVVFTITLIPAGEESLELTKISSDPVNVIEGGSAEMRVRTLVSGSPRASVTLTVTEGSPALTCPATVTTGADGRATIACQSSQVELNQFTSVTVTEGTRSVSFSVNVLDSAQADGLSKISGDGQVAGASSAFASNFVVSATVSGTPQANLRLTILPDSTLVFCDAQVFTDLNGLGAFQCNAGAAQNLTTVRIQVRDEFGRELQDPFRVTIVPGSVGDADSLTLLSSPQISVEAGGTLDNAIRVRALKEGEPAASVAVFFSSNQNVVFDPTVDTTSVSGEASTSVSVPCSPNSGTIRVGLVPGAQDLSIGYTAVAGGLDRVAKLGGDGQAAAAGTTFSTALLVRTEDRCGRAIPNQALTWDVVPANAATLINPFLTTNAEGQGSTRVRAGAVGGELTVRVRSGLAEAEFTLAVTNTPTVFQALSGGGQSIPVGEMSNSPLVVRVLNDSGEAVPNIPVSLSVLSGDVTLTSTGSSTDSAGRAETFVVAGGTRGEAVIEAAAIGQTVRFTVNVVGRTPTVPVEGFTNGASFQSGFTPGATGSIFGTGIVGDVEGVAHAPYPFPTEFHGVQVLVNGVAAPIFHLIRHQDGAEQINIQVPFSISASTTATVTILNNGAQASVTGIPVYGAQPGVFEVAVEGGLYAAALDQDFGLISPSNPVRAGGVVQLFMTGLGRTSPLVATNEVGPSAPPATVSADITVGLNDAGIPILGAFYAPGLVSVYQVNFVLPEAVPAGEHRIAIVVDGISSQTVTLVVSEPDGRQ